MVTAQPGVLYLLIEECYASANKPSLFSVIFSDNDWGVKWPPKRIVFKFHYHSQGVSQDSLGHLIWQIIIFHQPRFPWNSRGPISLTFHHHLGAKSVAMKFDQKPSLFSEASLKKVFKKASFLEFTIEFNLLLMAEILHQFIGSLSQYLWVSAPSQVVVWDFSHQQYLSISTLLIYLKKTHPVTNSEEQWWDPYPLQKKKWLKIKMLTCWWWYGWPSKNNGF